MATSKPKQRSGDIVRVIVAIFASVAFCAPLVAQSNRQSRVAAEAAPTGELTIGALEARLKEIQENDKLPEADRLKAADLYAKAISDLQTAKRSDAEQEQLKQAVASAQRDLERVRGRLEAPTEEIRPPAADADLVEVQQRLARLESQLAESEKRLSEREAEIARRARRRTEIPARLAEAKRQLEEVEQQLMAGPAEADPPEVQQARRAFLLARRQALQSEINLLEQEQPAYDATSRVLAAQRDLDARDVSQSRKLVSAWRDFVNQRRRTEAEQYAREARELAERVPPPARAIADEVLSLAERLVAVRKELARQLAATDTAIEGIEQQTNRLKQDFEELKNRAEAAGFTNAVGILLQERRSKLPDLREQRREIEQRQDTISDVHLQRIEYQNERSSLADIESLAEERASQIGRSLDERDLRDLQDAVRRLLQAKGRYLDGVIQDLSSYLDKLARLDASQRALVRETEIQADYIAEHILWVQTTTPIGLNTPGEAAATFHWITVNLPDLGTTLFADAYDNVGLYGFSLAALCLFLLVQGKLRQRLRQAGEQASRRITTSFQPTWVALGLTLILSVIWPAVIWILGWRLSEAGEPSAFAAAAGIACRAAALLWFTLTLFRRACRPDGLGGAHFGWPERSLNVVRGSLRWLILLSVPLAFLYVLTERGGNDVYRTSLGRLALIGALISLAAVLHRALKPSGCIVEEIVARGPRGWLARTRYLWYLLGVVLPLVLAFVAAAGYLYAARQLTWRLIESVWLVLAVLVVNALLRRWQLITYRALAMKQARERRAVAQQEGDESAGLSDAERMANIFDEMSEALSSSNVQTSKLFGILFAAVSIVGLGFIWADVMPALGMFSDVPLWESAIASVEAAGTVGQKEWITLADLLLALIAVAVTIAGSRNLPGLLEFVVLQRLPLDAGARYAVSSVCRYSITVVGFVLAFRMVGIGWSNVQWLVAAMTVGLGFGLQEIFANFVSGLILLFERPIRVGDTVTVGTVTGTVTRIRIRATTIVDWDRKELVVPNREFVTGQLINWTLSDAVLRVIVRVGIAYGSNTRLAADILYKVAEENPNVLEDPPPNVVFWTFGESSLDFELRVFVNTPQLYRTIAHELNLAIDDAFRENGIEIAFPQRDLHVRSIQAPLPVVRRDESEDRQAAASQGLTVGEETPGL